MNEFEHEAIKMVAVKSMELINAHFENNDTMDWDDCVHIQKQALKEIQNDVKDVV